MYSKKRPTFLISLFFVLAASYGQLAAQFIPNGNFENWNSSQGFNDPNNWSTNNIFSFFSGIDYCVTQEAPGAVGNCFCRLRCVADANGIPQEAKAISGNLNMLTNYGNAGFPIQNIPTTIVGQYRTQLVGNDLAKIQCVFTRTNPTLGNRDTIAAAYLDILTSQMDWTVFELSIIPIAAGTPDTCTITLTAGSGSSPQPSNYLDVDDLHFTGGASSIDEHTNPMFSIYPNPMNDLLMIDLSAMENSNDVSLFDTQGRLLERWQLGATCTTLNMAHLPAGSYIMHVCNQRGRWTQSLMKN